MGRVAAFGAAILPIPLHGHGSLVHHPRLFRFREQGGATRSCSEAERMGLSPEVSSGSRRSRCRPKTVTEVKRGKKVQVERKFMPGYVLAKLNLTDDVYHLVKNTPRSPASSASGSKPQPISEKEAARYFGGVPKRRPRPSAKHPRRLRDRRFGQGAAGPFASFNGVVEELDFDKSRVKVSVSIFGRATPVELGFEQVELVK
jgi:transcription termination/antitermination protein NusG